MFEGAAISIQFVIKRRLHYCPVTTPIKPHQYQDRDLKDSMRSQNKGVLIFELKNIEQCFPLGVNRDTYL